MDSIYSQFLIICQSCPDSPAITQDGDFISYKQLFVWCCQLANEIKYYKDGPIAIYADRSPELIVALLAVWKIDSFFCVIDPSNPVDRSLLCLKKIQPKLLLFFSDATPLTIKKLSASIPGMEILAIPLFPSEDFCIEDGVGFPPQEGFDATAYIVFTSGTTGGPKAVVTTHAPLTHFFKWYLKEFKINNDDRVSMLSGLAHDPIIRDVLTPFICGAMLCIPPKDSLGDAVKLIAWLQREKVTVVHATPSLAKMLCATIDSTSYNSLDHLRLIVLGGESLSFSLVSELRRLAPNAEIVNAYGATETPQIMSYYRMAKGTPAGKGVVPVGAGINDVKLLVLDKFKNPVPAGELGEVCISTQYLSKGYFNEDVLTANKFINIHLTINNEFVSHTTYCTGDLGYVDSAGRVNIKGRMDDQIKIRGFRIDPSEIEETLNQFPGVHRSVVVLKTFDNNNEKLVAFVESSKDIDLIETMNSLKSSLPSYMVPYRLVPLAKLPHTNNGKIDRKSLSEKPLEIETAGGGALNDTQLRVIALFEKVLKVKNIGIRDNFFDLGGDSLSSVVLLIEIEREFQVQLEPSDLLIAPVVADLSSKIEKNELMDHAPALIPLCTEGKKAPIYWVPGGGGMSVTAFRNISRLIGGKHPVYGLVASRKCSSHPDVINRATEYVNLIKSQQPTGPYFLLGFSAGSWLAYEMALQFQDRGDHVGGLTVFDMPVCRFLKLGERARLLTQLIFRHINAYRATDGNKRRNYLEKYILPFYWDIIKDFKAKRAKNADVYDKAEYLNRKATKTYRKNSNLRKFHGVITVILAETSLWSVVDKSIDPRLKWENLTSEGIRPYFVEGQHISMLDQPHVEKLSEVLRREMVRWADL